MRNISRLGGKPSARLSRENVQALFCDAGFRPGRRGPFVPAKGPKTINAPSGLIGKDRRRLVEGGPTRFAQTRPAS